jgi:NAD(P)-dependent dehydrogenase (short-subunit alcohol dehydrogenase family)
MFSGDLGGSNRRLCLARTCDQAQLSIGLRHHHIVRAAEQMTDFSGKVAVVLGASASAGCGWAIAEALAAKGAKVVVGARRYELLKTLADGIGGTPVACDATKEDQVRALAETALKTYGKVDIAITTAGERARGLVADATTELVQRGLEGNFFSQFFFVKHMARAIKENGSIVLFSTVCTTHTFLPMFPHACAKAAADCLVRYAALEYGPQRIRVNSILPGAIMTEMGRPTFSIPGMTEAWAKEVPLGRIGEPRDFVDAALWLAGSSFVTGLNLHVSGGHQLTRLPYIEEMPTARL